MPLPFATKTGTASIEYNNKIILGCKVDLRYPISLSTTSKLFFERKMIHQLQSQTIIFDHIITDSNNEYLVAFSTHLEILITLSSTGGLKAPGLDSFLAIFFKNIRELYTEISLSWSTTSSPKLSPCSTLIKPLLCSLIVAFY